MMDSELSTLLYDASHINDYFMPIFPILKLSVKYIFYIYNENVSGLSFKKVRNFYFILCCQI